MSAPYLKRQDAALLADAEAGEGRVLELPLFISRFEQCGNVGGEAVLETPLAIVLDQHRLSQIDQPQPDV